jgi:hypothetical protein
LSSAFDITAKPRSSAVSFSTSGAASASYAVSQLAPCVMTIFRFHWSCGSAGIHGSGVRPLSSKRHSTAIRYSSRSIAPVSTRTMNGTSIPSSVVVVAISDAAGGSAGS